MTLSPQLVLNLDMVTVVPTYDLTWTWCLSFPHEPHLDLVTVVFLSTHINLVTPVPTRASPASGDSGLQVGLTWTW